MKKLRAVIADDEMHCIETLEWQLSHYCPEIDLVRTFRHSLECQDYLQEADIDLAFLDVEMPMLNGSDLLKSLVRSDIRVIFTTAYGDFDQGDDERVIGLLLKPVDHLELKSLLQDLI